MPGQVEPGPLLKPATAFGKLFGHLLPVGIMLLAAGCRADRSGTKLALQLDSLPAPPPVALSRFNIPLTYDYGAVLDVIERAVPRTFGDIDSVHMAGDDPNRHYAYEAKRSAFETFVRDNEVHLRATLSYQARGYFKPRIGPTLSAGCGSDKPSEQPRLSVELVAPLTLTADWHLSSHTRIARMRPASSTDRDRCAVSIIRYDVTQRVIDAARSALEGELPDIDRRIASVDLTERFNQWWLLLNRPIRLADNVWLLLGPERLRMGQINPGGNKHELIVEAGLDARPRIVTGTEPRTTTLLPPLARDTAGSGFHVMLEGNIDYATASSTLSDALRGKSITEAGRTVTVSEATVSPLPRGRLALAIGFTGDASGTLVFVGSPKYDRASGQLAVPNLDYDLTTDSNLITAYAWLKSDALRTMFREKATIPVQPLLDRGRDLLLSGLNRKLGDDVTISATVDSVDVAGIYVTTPGIVVRAIATGNAGMQVRQER